MSPLLVLLHGLGGNARVWDKCEEAYPGAVLAPDLAGHGQASTLDRYHYEAYAEDLTDRYATTLSDQPFYLIGHSLGGVVGAALLQNVPTLQCLCFVALGVKTQWAPEEIAGAHRVANKGVQHFADGQSARARYLKVSGLEPLVEHDSPVANRGIRAVDSGYRLATDPEAYRLQPSDFGRFVRNLTPPVILARGEHDTMAPSAELARFGLPVVDIPNAGHNAHVERPEAVLALLPNQ
ncbi:MAG: alpha/beta hydrolase [Gammaproteobacteria bacterium]|nr:alpha/beta hydrolase [Gammaproteobacteria bacterium]